MVAKTALPMKSKRARQKKKCSAVSTEQLISIKAKNIDYNRDVQTDKMSRLTIFFINFCQKVAVQGLRDESLQKYFEGCHVLIQLFGNSKEKTIRKSVQLTL